ncbi:MAG: sigma 54-interacting transcriptional regulator, partial [Bdellovibrionaceae bacterium]|nr:sigma 54-interacting transcriptional regulator [Pseudobdellovibrionaceae bacterium]
MINWEEFEYMHVIRKFRHILGSWWGVDVLLTDEQGNIKTFPNSKVHFVNPAIEFLLQKEVVQQQLKEFIARAIDDLRMVDKNYLVRYWEVGGFSWGIFPIIIDRDFLGSVVVGGFFEARPTEKELNNIRDRLAAFGASFTLIETAIPKFDFLEGKDLQHFIELGILLAEEIVTLYVEVEKRENQIRELNKEIGGRYRYDNMIGKSKPMQALYNLLDKIKTADSTVLIQGENGTGKELIAKSIHYNSPRKDKPFVVQNCSAFNDNLLESELFGHVKGAFTGAVRDKKGLFEVADKGTFFLDEIGETSPQMQVKLLRVLQEGTFTPVGSTEQKKVDVRIIAATNRNLREMVEKGTFREDLYYRLNVISIRVPPLRERKEDIPLLVEYFLQKICETQNCPRKTITKRAMEILYDYAWPGNVRELQNEIERIVVLSGDETKITPEMLSPKIVEYIQNSKHQGARLEGKLKD